MSAAGASSLRTLAFGDLDAAVWGAAWVPDPSRPGFVGLGTGPQSVTVAAGLAQDGDAGDWRLDGDGVQLTASAAAGLKPSSGGTSGNSFIKFKFSSNSATRPGAWPCAPPIMVTKKPPSGSE